MSAEYVEYRIYPEQLPKSFDLVFVHQVYGVEKQEDVPLSLKIKDLLPSYIFENDLKNSREQFIKSFFFPSSKQKWLNLYNLRNIKYCRNFCKSIEVVGTESVRVGDRRYKKGYRTESHKRFDKFYKHHIFLPWSELSEDTQYFLASEYDKVVDEAVKKNDSGKKVILPIFLIVTIVAFFINKYLCIALVLLFMFLGGRYFINRKQIAVISEKLGNDITEAFELQDEELVRVLLPKEKISYYNPL